MLFFIFAGKTGAFALPTLQMLYEYLRGDANISQSVEMKVSGAGDSGSPASAASAAFKQEGFVLSVFDRDSICAVDPAGLLCQTRHPQNWAGVRCNTGVLQGSSSLKVQFEATVTDEGLCRVGWTLGRNGTRNLGTDALSFGFGGTGKRSNANKFEDYGESFGLKDVIGCYLDLPAEGAGDASLSFSKNGQSLGIAFNLPAALLAANPGVFPAVVLKNAEMAFNFGTDKSKPFKFPRAGYIPIAQVPEGQRTSPATPEMATSAPSGAGAGAGGSGGKQNRPQSAAGGGTNNPNRPAGKNFQGPAGAAAPAGASASASSSKPRPGIDSKSPFCVIFEPTRELAQQVSDEIEKFKVHLQDPMISHECFVGGGDIKSMIKALQRGVNIVIGTPGRLMELIKGGHLDVSGTRSLILDEADQLIVDSSTQKDILSVYEKMSARTQKGTQVIICSATLHSEEIQSLANKITTNATWVDLKGKDAIPDTVDHVVVIADPMEDRTWVNKSNSIATDGVHMGINLRSRADNPELLSEAVKILKPSILLQVIDEFNMDQCMIFVRTQLGKEETEKRLHMLQLAGLFCLMGVLTSPFLFADCDNLESFLLSAGGGSKGQAAAKGMGFEKRESGKEHEYSCVVLHGGRSPPERNRNLEAFKNGDVRFLICTDVAARGIDIKNLPYMLNLTLPDKPETYIHRIGRVGRADAIGLAISIVAQKGVKEKQWYHTCNSKDKGRSCDRRQLVSQGGCTIWFDEHDMLTQIEGRLGGITVPRLERNNLVKGAKHIVELASKGRKQVDDGSATADLHVNVLKPKVEELAHLEFTAQCQFWNIKQTQKWQHMLR
jgi:ATP-dependent RNA helicase DDX1